MSFGQIINYLLYGLSGFCFGMFASRWSVLSVRHIRSKYSEEGISCLASCLPQFLFLFCSFFLFPAWFTEKTVTGGFFYYACLVFFFSRGISLRRDKR